MESGYVFLSLKPGKKKDFITKIKEVRGVEEARLVMGIFDAVAKIEGTKLKATQGKVQKGRNGPA